VSVFLLTVTVVPAALTVKEKLSPAFLVTVENSTGGAAGSVTTAFC
jgi:hypothetical protein